MWNNSLQRDCNGLFIYRFAFVMDYPDILSTAEWFKEQARYINVNHEGEQSNSWELKQSCSWGKRNQVKLTKNDENTSITFVVFLVTC